MKPGVVDGKKKKSGRDGKREEENCERVVVGQVGGAIKKSAPES